MIAGSTSGQPNGGGPSPSSFLHPSGGVHSVRHSNIINLTKNDLLIDSTT